jgi:hypothetical protein
VAEDAGGNFREQITQEMPESEQHQGGDGIEPKKERYRDQYRDQKHNGGAKEPAGAFRGGGAGRPLAAVLQAEVFRQIAGQAQRTAAAECGTPHIVVQAANLIFVVRQWLGSDLLRPRSRFYLGFDDGHMTIRLSAAIDPLVIRWGAGHRMRE